MDGRIDIVHGMHITNQLVVTYWPYMLTRYNSHINVEVCLGVKAIKYLFKYIYKGHDRCAIYVQSNNGENVIDEMQTFKDAWWVSPPEELWRVYELNLT